MKVERLSLSSSTASAASRRCGSTRSDGRVAVLAGARLRRICDADCTRRCGIANAGAPMGAGDQEPSGAGPRPAGSWVWGVCVGVWACRGGGRARVRSYGGKEGDAEGGGLGLVEAVFLQGLLDGGAFDFLDADRTTGRGVHG